MKPEYSDIEITGRETEPISYFVDLLGPNEIGIRVTEPKPLRNDYICKGWRARNTLLYLLERIAAAVEYQQVLPNAAKTIPPRAGFTLID